MFRRLKQSAHPRAAAEMTSEMPRVARTVSSLAGEAFSFGLCTASWRWTRPARTPGL